MASSASLGIPRVSDSNSRLSFFGDNNPRNRDARQLCSVIFRNRVESGPGNGRRISMSMTAKTPTSGKLEVRSHGNTAKIACESLDKWMRDSVVDIVKKLDQAPLLVQVFEENENRDRDEKSGAGTRLETETAVEDNWAALKGRWESGEAPSPQGVIFVEDLGNGEEEEGERSERESRTKAWGIVVQGRGAECGPVCYLLKTSRVKGLGSACCTHFCLARVKGFRETTESQLKNCWLVRAQSQGYL